MSKQSSVMLKDIWTTMEINKNKNVSQQREVMVSLCLRHRYGLMGDCFIISGSRNSGVTLGLVCSTGVVPCRWGTIPLFWN